MADFTASATVNDGYRYVFVAFDVFLHTSATLYRLKTKASEVVRAMKISVKEMGTPEQIYHDNEGSFNRVEFIRLIKSKHIKQIVTSSPPPFAERIIQTAKVWYTQD